MGLDTLLDLVVDLAHRVMGWILGIDSRFLDVPECLAKHRWEYHTECPALHWRDPSLRKVCAAIAKSEVVSSTD
jgi:hypothetical protein